MGGMKEKKEKNVAEVEVTQPKKDKKDKKPCCSCCRKEHTAGVGKASVDDGGIQIKRTQEIREHPSQVKVGGLNEALLDIPSVILNQLHPKKQIDENEPIFPTQSRIDRCQEKQKRKETCSTKVTRKLSLFDLWAIQTIPPADVLAFNIAVAIAPVLFLLTIWDLLAVMVFFIPHMSFLNLPGFLYPFYPIGTIASFYGYMMRFLMEDYSNETYICYAGVIIYPLLLTAQCLLHYFFNEYRDEAKLWY